MFVGAKGGIRGSAVHRDTWVWVCRGTEFLQYSEHQRGQEMDGWAVATQEYPPS